MDRWFATRKVGMQNHGEVEAAVDEASFLVLGDTIREEQVRKRGPQTSMHAMGKPIRCKSMVELASSISDNDQTPTLIKDDCTSLDQRCAFVSVVMLGWRC